jgi:hypothetical protein
MGDRVHPRHRGPTRRSLLGAALLAVPARMRPAVLFLALQRQLVYGLSAGVPQ